MQPDTARTLAAPPRTACSSRSLITPAVCRRSALMLISRADGSSLMGKISSMLRGRPASPYAAASSVATCRPRECGRSLQEMDQASASPVASCAHNPAAPRTLPSWLPSEGQARTVVPSRDGSAPQSVPHSEPVHIVPRPSSPALCQSDAKGYLLLDYYSGATGIPGRFSEGLLLRRLHMAD